MTITATQSGFTNNTGDVTKIVDGSTSTGWSVVPYSDSVPGRSITIDMGGWFDGSLLTNIDRYNTGYAQTRVDRFAIQLSADGIDWYNTGGVYLFGPVGWGPITPGWTGFTVPAWPRAEYFRYVRFISTDGIYTPNGGALVLNEMRFCKNTTGTWITIDTSGGANPTPPTGTPDPSPPTPGDSGVETRVTSAFAAVMRVDNSEVRVTAAFLQVMMKAPTLLRVALSDESQMFVDITRYYKARMTDDSIITANLLVLTPIHVSASLTDDAIIEVTLQSITPITLNAALLDEAEIGVFTSLDIVYPSWSSYNTGRS